MILVRSQHITDVKLSTEMALSFNSTRITSVSRISFWLMFVFTRRLSLRFLGHPSFLRAFI